MLDHDAFGLTGRARGVDDVGEVLGGEADGFGVWVGCGLDRPVTGIGFQIEHRQIQGQPVLGLLTRLCQGLVQAGSGRRHASV